jgi:hypothetical protein
MTVTVLVLNLATLMLQEQVEQVETILCCDKMPLEPRQVQLQLPNSTFVDLHKRMFQ